MIKSIYQIELIFWILNDLLTMNQKNIFLLSFNLTPSSHFIHPNTSTLSRSTYRDLPKFKTHPKTQLNPNLDFKWFKIFL